MRMQEFFDHHGLAANPFADEEAQNDPIFKRVMSSAVFHPAWDKIYGRPEEVGTAIVFGEKGSGKTALRLQMIEHLERHNCGREDGRIFVVQYDDFNPLLDRFSEARGGAGRESLGKWRIWDHMDSILSIAVSNVVDRLLGIGREGAADALAFDLGRAARMTPAMKRDLLMLAAFYDHSRQATFTDRWRRLAGRLGYWTALGRWRTLVGIAGSIAAAALGVLLLVAAPGLWPWTLALTAALAGASWHLDLRRSIRLGRMSRRILRDVAVVPRHLEELKAALSRMRDADMHDQPVPVAELSDSRYQLLHKFQGVTRELGFGGVIVIMDRIDEPHLINGAPEAMKDFVWPLLDNKLLKMPGLAFKLLLPIDLKGFLHKESKEFYERSRLDKQNTVDSLEWSGQSLYDMAGERLTAALPEERQAAGEKLSLRHLVSDELSTDEIIHSLGHFRVPRHLFKFLYRLITEHCNEHTSESPEWRIGKSTFRTVEKLYLRDLEAFDRGYGHG